MSSRPSRKIDTQQESLAGRPVARGMTDTVITIQLLDDPGSLQVFASLEDAVLLSPALEGRRVQEFIGVDSIRVGDYLLLRRPVRSATPWRRG
ncbi:MAG TPA: hypothetical protein VM869_19420 [Enhygromyxa sp.]|jgi:hypothetical protein|nr:hypothetical protein [Enhygromyxa sp.]